MQYLGALEQPHFAGAGTLSKLEIWNNLNSAPTPEQLQECYDFMLQAQADRTWKVDNNSSLTQTLLLPNPEQFTKAIYQIEWELQQLWNWFDQAINDFYVKQWSSHGIKSDGKKIETVQAGLWGELIDSIQRWMNSSTENISISALVLIIALLFFFKNKENLAETWALGTIRKLLRTVFMLSLILILRKVFEPSHAAYTWPAIDAIQDTPWAWTIADEIQDGVREWNDFGAKFRELLKQEWIWDTGWWGFAKLFWFMIIALPAWVLVYKKKKWMMWAILAAFLCWFITFLWPKATDMFLNNWTSWSSRNSSWHPMSTEIKQITPWDMTDMQRRELLQRWNDNTFVIKNFAYQKELAELQTQLAQNNGERSWNIYMENPKNKKKVQNYIHAIEKNAADESFQWISLTITPADVSQPYFISPKRYAKIWTSDEMFSLVWNTYASFHVNIFIKNGETTVIAYFKNNSWNGSVIEKKILEKSKITDADIEAMTIWAILQATKWRI